jgi:hypothetical protein
LDIVALKKDNGFVAQLAEQWAFNPVVVGQVPREHYKKKESGDSSIGRALDLGSRGCRSSPVAPKKNRIAPVV